MLAFALLILITSCIYQTIAVFSIHRGNDDDDALTGHEACHHPVSGRSPGTRSDYYRGRRSFPRLNGPIEDSERPLAG